MTGTTAFVATLRDPANMIAISASLSLGHEPDVPPEDVTIELIAEMLVRAGIDHAPPQDGCVYAFGIDFPIWISIDDDARSIHLNTHTPAVPDTDDLAGLRLANRCNADFALVQFTWHDAGRMNGHYCLPYADGLKRAQLLRCAHRFASIFTKAVREGVAAGLLTYPGAEASAPPLLN